MSPRTKDHARTILLPPAVDAALVRAAKKEGRPVRLYAARLLAAALGLACLVLAGCSGATGGPLVVDDDAGLGPDTAGSDAYPTIPDGGCPPGLTVKCPPGDHYACLGEYGNAGYAECGACGSDTPLCSGCMECASRCGQQTGDLATEEAFSACAEKCRC
jgi:hypothetical protein